jgi:hypothetical protein
MHRLIDLIRKCTDFFFLFFKVGLREDCYDE